MNRYYFLNIKDKVKIGDNVRKRMDKIIVIVGPTAVGKTALSIELAKKYDGEIINADSMQVYRGLDIGTAKVTVDESDGIAHHLIDIYELNETYTVADFRLSIRKKRGSRRLPTTRKVYTICAKSWKSRTLGTIKSEG